MNTSLFIDVKVNFTNWYNDSLDIQADVKERWYYIVLPYFKPIDRNWNIWIKDYALSMDRVNYGVKFLGKNITGRTDRLNIWALNGYTKKLAFNYYNPFADNKLRHGFGFDFSYAQNKEVNFDTKENVQKFYKSETKYLKKQLYAGLIYSYRRGSVERHFFRVGLHKESVDDTIALLNPNYFSARKLQVVYPELRYTYQNYKLNYIPYPTKGELIELELTKRGFSKDMNLFQLYLKAGKYFKLPKNMYIGSVAEMHLRLPFDQPFFNQSMLGYNDSYLRGMEYYVVDGVAGGFIRNTTYVALNGYTNYLDGYNNSDDVEELVLTSLQSGKKYKYNLTEFSMPYINFFIFISDNSYYLEWTDLNGVNIETVALQSNPAEDYLLILPVNNYYNDFFAPGNIFKIIKNDDVIFTATFIPEEECKYEPLQCSFINKMGGWEFLTFFKARTQTWEVKNKEYQLLPNDVDYNPLRGESKAFNYEAKQSIKINTGWVEEHYNELIKDLMTSETILLDNKPVKLKTMTTELKTSLQYKMINYQIEIEYNYNQINNVI